MTNCLMGEDMGKKSDMRGITNRAYIIMKHIPENTNSIIDIGCGLGDWGYLFKTRLPNDIFLVGLDVYQPYIDNISRFNLYDKLMCGDIKNMEIIDYYDVGIMIDVLEHIKKEEALKVLNKLKRICNKLIVSLPRGFLPHDAIDENKYQAHTSGWDVEDFTKLNFKVLTINRGIRLLNFPFEILKWILGKRSGHLLAIWEANVDTVSSPIPLNEIDAKSELNDIPVNIPANISY